MSANRAERSAPASAEMNRRQFLLRSGTAAVAFSGAGGLLAACSGGSPAPVSASQQNRAPATVTVWDYYGSSTPVKPALAGFKQRYPWITINYQGLDWDTISTKFTVSVSSGSAPDMATLDMTWIPTYASNGLLMELSKVAGDTLNGKPIKDQYSGGALNAMTYQGHFVTMLFDADCYALYYRRDLFEKKGISVPTNWDEFRAAAKALATDTNGDGKADKYLMELDPDVFHYAAYLFQNGGAILDPANSKAVFNSPEGVRALEMYKGFLDDGTGIYWGPGQGDRVAGLKDGTVAMFEDGPYYMGIMKDGAPEMRGKWAIATAPYSAKPGSYVGGTGLSIPVNAAHPEAAWKLIQYLLEPQNSIGVAKYSGAAPGTAGRAGEPRGRQAGPLFRGTGRLESVAAH